MDKWKIVKGLECHQIDNNHRINCANCPYYADDNNHIRCVNDLHDDAIALIKEQEAINAIKLIETIKIPIPIGYTSNGIFYKL